MCVKMNLNMSTGPRHLKHVVQRPSVHWTRRGRGFESGASTPRRDIDSGGTYYSLSVMMNPKSKMAGRVGWI
jgi:hypothetical protein